MAQPTITTLDAPNEASSNLCQALLVSLHLEDNQEALRNTLLKIFIDDYPLFTSSFFNLLIINEFKLIGEEYPRGGFSDRFYEAQEESLNMPQDQMRLSAVARTIESIWQPLLHPSNNLKLSVAQNVSYHHLLNFIDQNAKLKAAMLDVIKSLVINGDTWKPVLKSYRLASTSHRKERMGRTSHYLYFYQTETNYDSDDASRLRKKLMRQFAKRPVFTIPPNASPKAILDHVVAEPQPLLKRSEIENLLKNPATLSKGIHQLNMTVITLGETFRSHQEWINIYEAAGSWIKNEDSNHKIQFIKSHTAFKILADGFIANLKEQQEILDLALKQEKNEEQSEDLKVIENYLRQWIDSTQQVKEEMKSLHQETMGYESHIQNAETFKNTLIKVQKLLHLDRSLLRFLKKGWF